MDFGFSVLSLEFSKVVQSRANELGGTHHKVVGSYSHDVHKEARKWSEAFNTSPLPLAESKPRCCKLPTFHTNPTLPNKPQANQT